MLLSHVIGGEVSACDRVVARVGRERARMASEYIRCEAISDPRRRLLVVAACSLMAVPYVQQYDYVMLWVLAADGVGLVSYLHGPLFSAFGWDAARGFQTFMPLAVYAMLVAEPLHALVRDRRGRRVRQAA